MEVFIDFGFFELASAAVLALLSRWIFRQRVTATLFLVVSVAAPAGILLLPTSVHRVLVIAILAASIVSASALGMIVMYCPEAFDTATARALATAEKAFPRIARLKAFQRVRGLVAPRS